MLLPVPVFIDTSAMPRHLAHIPLDFDQLMQLAKENLVAVYMSEIAIREWRSQIVGDYSRLVRKMHTGVKAVFDQANFRIPQNDLISRLASNRTTLLAEAEAAASTACDDFLGRLGVTRLPIADDDAVNVFQDYFNGVLPFGQPKQRADIPDAFILRAARRIPHLFTDKVIAVCCDCRLGKSLASIPEVHVVESVKGFLQMDLGKQVTRDLKVSEVWREKRDDVVAFLKDSHTLIEGRLQEFVSGLLGDTVYSNDGNEGTIEAIRKPRELALDWEHADVWPGLVAVPFEITCDASIEYAIPRSDIYLVPIGFHLIDGDTGEYVDASVNQVLHIRGGIGLHYTLEELQSSRVTLPKDVDFLEVNVAVIESGE